MGLLQWAAAAAGLLLLLWLATELLPRLAAAAPPRPAALPRSALPVYERLLWLARHPAHRLVHGLGWLLCAAAWPCLRKGRTPARVAADAAVIAALPPGAEVEVDSFHLEALEHQLPDFAPWWPCGPIYPFGKQLANKMRLAAWRREHPEVCATELKLPLWVVGLPRTGSTIFHKLLSLDPNARTIRAWELRHPIPPARPETWATDTRFVEFNRGGQLAYGFAPAMKSIHYVTAADPDECIWGMVDCAEPLHLWGALEQQSSYEWYVGRRGGLHEMYEHYRQLLQVLCGPDGTTIGTHLVLKSPHHTFHLPSIASAFGPKPSVFIWLHRQPVSVVGSCCSMNLHFREYMSAGFESPATLGARTLERLAACITKAMADRAVLEAAGHTFVDIRYDDLMADAVGVIRKLYATVGLQFEEEFGRRIEGHLAEGRAARQKGGGAGGGGRGHSYSLEMFGLSKEDVEAAFATYMRKYL